METETRKIAKLISKYQLSKQSKLPSSDDRQLSPRIAPTDDNTISYSTIKMQQNANWVLGMTCLHRGLASMDDIPSVTTLHQDEDAAKCQLGPGNDLPT